MKVVPSEKVQTAWGRPMRRDILFISRLLCYFLCWSYSDKVIQKNERIIASVLLDGVSIDD